MRWVDGVYLGMRERTDEYLLGTPEGVIKIHTISRKGTVEQQWNTDEMLKMQGVPWQPLPGREGIEIRARIDMPGNREPPYTGGHRDRER